MSDVRAAQSHGETEQDEQAMRQIERPRIHSPQCRRGKKDFDEKVALLGISLSRTGGSWQCGSKVGSEAIVAIRGALGTARPTSTFGYFDTIKFAHADVGRGVPTAPGLELAHTTSRKGPCAERAKCLARACLTHDLSDHLAMHICQTKVAASVTIGQLFVI